MAAEEWPASPRDQGSEHSSNTTSSFVLLQRVNVIFQLPDGRVLDKTFATLPGYGVLWKQVRDWTSEAPFQLLLDDVRLSNKNAAAQLHEAIADQLSHSTADVPSVQIVVKEHHAREERQSIEVAPIQADEVGPREEWAVPWRVLAVCTATVTAMVCWWSQRNSTHRAKQNALLNDEVQRLKDKVQRQDETLQGLGVEKAALREHLEREVKAKAGLEQTVQKASIEHARLTQNVGALAAQKKHLEDIGETKDRYINQLVKQGKIDALDKRVKRYQEVDLLFMVDCTSSMLPYIVAVKGQIRKIVHRIRGAYPQLNLNLGFLGYRDLCDKEQFEMLPFSEDISKFEEFVARIVAHGGGDAAEDIAGAVQRAAQLWNWQRAVRVLFHIADAPCHGSKYHDLPERCDGYPSGTGTSIVDQISILRALSIDYYFGRITHHTDKMVTCLNEELGLREGRLYISTVSIEDPLQIEKAVAQSVCTSIHLTGLEVPKSHGEDEEVVSISDEEPEWELLEAGEKRHGKMFSTSIPDSMGSLPQTRMSSDVDFVIAPTPFAQGESRLCHWGVYRKPGQDWSHGVFKQFKKRAQGTQKEEIQRYQAEIDKSVIAEYFARKFNEVMQPAWRIEFLIPEMVEDMEGDRTCYSVECVLPDYRNMTKYNDNKATWEPNVYEKELGDFTRWTYEFSGREYMVADLQGVKHNGSFVLTDPAILHREIDRFGGTNTGPQFMEKTLANIPRTDAARSRL